MLLQGAGFEVVNLGTGVTPRRLRRRGEGARRRAIVGMSALLTTTLPHMAETIAALKDEGLREQVKVMVGGAPVTAAYADEIGADGYGANAGMAVERAKELVGREPDAGTPPSERATAGPRATAAPASGASAVRLRRPLPRRGGAGAAARRHPAAPRDDGRALRVAQSARDPEEGRREGGRGLRPRPPAPPARRGGPRSGAAAVHARRPGRRPATCSSARASPTAPPTAAASRSSTGTPASVVRRPRPTSRRSPACRTASAPSATGGRRSAPATAARRPSCTRWRPAGTTPAST